MKISILNSPILTNEGEYNLRSVSPMEAKQIIIESGFVSYIGHESTASAISTLLGVEIPVNRSMFSQQKGELALVFSLSRRLGEGEVLQSVEDINKVGFKLQLLQRKA